MFILEHGREHLWQWDINQRVMVEDTTITEVHFCNKTTPNSLVVETYIEDGELFANIPNILLQDNWDICVYAYCDCYTKVEERVKVKARSKPSDYVYTETEVKEWNDLVQRLDEIEKKGVSDEVVANAVEQYLIDNPIETGATDEQVAQINRNTSDIADIDRELDGKLDKLSTKSNGVYAVLGTSPDEPFIHPYSDNADANTIAKRGSSGALMVGNPTHNKHATTKAYVDNAVQNVQVDLTGYATEQWVTNKGYLTTIPSEYVTDTELNSKKFATEQYVTDAIANIDISGEDIDLTDYYTKEETEQYVTDAIAEVAVGDLSIVLTDDGEGNVTFVGSTLTDGEEVQY